MAKDEDAAVSGGMCEKHRTSCRTYNITAIGVLVTIIALVIAGVWSTVGKSQDAIAALQQDSASQAATLTAIKDDTKEIKELLRYERARDTRR